MENTSNINKWLFLTCLILISWVIVFLLLGRFWPWQGARDIWGIMLIGAAVITFFGFLTMPGNINEKGKFQESRIRLSIAATLIVAYLVYFGSVVYLDPEIDKETGKVVKTFAEDMLPTLTNLLTITISFYFGSTAAIEVAGKLSQKNGSKEED